jgi:L-malate glycosyltransferase
MATWLTGRTIHQLVVSASPRDAVTNSALEIRSLLRQHGPSEVFALNRHHEVAHEIHDADAYVDFLPQEKDPFTLIHLSMGDERFLPFVQSLPGQFILSYHNLTPAKYFAAWDPSTARKLEEGTVYLERLRGRTSVALADSEFNATDLRASGYECVTVGGLILGREALLDLAPASIVAPTRGPVILSVGQLYPHKRPDVLIAAFHELVTWQRPDAHLVLAGAARLRTYADAVERYISRLGLGPRVTVTGSITDAELAAWYRRADLFVVASEHEGFCVPLVEAMLFEVPIVGRANGAVAETTLDAGVVLRGDASPTVMAEVMREVLDDRPAANA